MIDLHCHVLPGIDDGPATFEDSLALLRAAHAAGTRTILATPHVSTRYPNDAATIARVLAELHERMAVEGIDVTVLPGGEIALTSAIEIAPERLGELALGGGEWLLIEPPFTPTATGIDSILLDLLQRRHKIVLAHPERCAAFHRDRRVLESVVAAGVLTSITAGSLVGRFGGEVRRFALELLRDGLVHNVASDAHDDADRPPGMRAELATAGVGSLEDWLTGAVPRAILDGAKIPAAPVAPPVKVPSRHPRWWRR